MTVVPSPSGQTPSPPRLLGTSHFVLTFLSPSGFSDIQQRQFFPRCEHLVSSIKLRCEWIFQDFEVDNFCHPRNACWLIITRGHIQPESFGLRGLFWTTIIGLGLGSEKCIFLPPSEMNSNMATSVRPTKFCSSVLFKRRRLFCESLR